MGNTLWGIVATHTSEDRTLLADPAGLRIFYAPLISIRSNR